MSLVVTGDRPSLPRPRRAGRTPIWVKLWTLVIIGNFAGFVVAVWAAGLIRAVSASETTQTALLFGYYAAMAVVAFLDALLVDELLFKGAFRQTYLQGKGQAKDAGDGDVKAVVATLQRSRMSFPFLLLACGTVTYLLFNLVNHDFDVYYRRVGKHINAMYQGSDAEQIQAIRELSVRRDPKVLPALKKRLAQGGEPARWAAWALGRFTDLPTRRPLKLPLVAATKSTDEGLRLEALVALGRIQHRPIAETIHTEIRARQQLGKPIDPRLIYALGSVQVLSSVPVLEDLLHTGSPEIQRISAWALAQHRDQRGGREVVDVLEARLPTAGHEVRCAIVHSLGILADEKSNLALTELHDGLSPAEQATICPRWQLSMRPDGDTDDRVELFMPQDTLSMKVIMTMAQMRATSPEVRAEVEPWLERVIADEESTPATKEAGKSLLAGIREGRDDSQMKSIDEALGLEEPDDEPAL